MKWHLSQLISTCFPFDWASPDLANHRHHLRAGVKYINCKPSLSLRDSDEVSLDTRNPYFWRASHMILMISTALNYCPLSSQLLWSGKKSPFSPTPAVRLLHGIQLHLKQRTSLEMNGFWEEMVKLVPSSWHVWLSMPMPTCEHRNGKWGIHPPTIYFGHRNFTLFCLSLRLSGLWSMKFGNLWGYFSVRGKSNSSRGDIFSTGFGPCCFQGVPWKWHRYQAWHEVLPRFWCLITWGGVC